MLKLFQRGALHCLNSFHPYVTMGEVEPIQDVVTDYCLSDVSASLFRLLISMNNAPSRF